MASKGIGWELVESVGKLKQNIDLLDFTKYNEVYVGIPQEDNEREETNDVTNAELLFIHTNGSPVKNIPARPVIEPAIKDDSERLAKMMAKAAVLVLKGKKKEATEQLKKTGMRGQNVSRNWFYSDKNGWPELSEKTVQVKIKKHKNIKGYIPRTLVDTSQMKNAITYFVNTRSGREK